MWVFSGCSCSLGGSQDLMDQFQGFLGPHSSLGEDDEVIGVSNVPEVPFGDGHVQRVQMDVGQQRRQRTTLGCSGFRGLGLLVVGESNAASEDRSDQIQDTTVRDFLGHGGQGNLVVHRLTEAADIGIEDELLPPPVDGFVHRRQSCLASLTGAEAVGVFTELHRGDRSLDLQEGDSVAAYTAVGVLADPRQVEITAQLGSEELSQMALNQQAVIALRNRPGETFHGTVRQLPYPYGGTTIDTGGDDTAVHVSFEGEADLVIGELATVTIVLQEKEDVLWLPPAAIRTYQGRNFCVVQNPDGSQKRVDVLLGIVTEEKAEIAAGLEAGQIVVGE